MTRDGIRLVLVRHAKSDWGDPSIADHDRPLNERGLRDAPRMARRLAESGFEADAIVTSTALRARTTAAAFGEALGVRVTADERLYGASARTLWSRASDADAARIVLVAHDPGMSVLAARLSGDRIEHMPTCAVATFAWDDDDWNVVDALEPSDWSFDTPR
ncbi:histidine phosphatase family protein [Microbacterium sp. BWT-B31]|uniref:SixA phosphatase family protein n=1 Tax=Microbacterium sp. BWT-B31 TaxID=3232072 RepID=UPI003526D55D